MGRPARRPLQRAGLLVGEGVAHIGNDGVGIRARGGPEIERLHGAARGLGGFRSDSHPENRSHRENAKTAAREARKSQGRSVGRDMDLPRKRGELQSSG